jgi:hypothetical protein
MRRAAQFLIIGVFLLFVSGCGSQSQFTPPPPNNANPADVPVSITITDTPPAGVTVLFFQLSITGATLTSSSGTSVSLLPSTNPIPVNITQLQTESAFLGSKNVPAGTYTGLSLTFSPNTQLTIFNGSTTTYGTVANPCAPNKVCKLTPTPTKLGLTFTTSPFPVTLAANSPLAFKLDIHLDTVIQQDLSVDLTATNGVTISKLSLPPSGGRLGKLTGIIQSVNASASPNSFTLLSGDDRTFNIAVNSSTTYKYPTSVCSTNNFACLAAQQIVKVEVSLQTGGTLLAVEVDYVQPIGQVVVEGNIIRLSTSGGNTLMDMILQKGPPTASALPFGGRATVTVPPTGVTYAVDNGSFTIPSGLTFAGASNLLVGQQVEVVIQGPVTTSSGSGNSTSYASPGEITFTTNSITLEPSQITGSVAAVNAPQLS